MSIIVPDDDFHIEISDSSRANPTSIKQIPIEGHINSRNIKRNSLSNSNSQYSTKEGTPNKEGNGQSNGNTKGNVESKTMEIRNIKKELEKVSYGSSPKDKLSNITQILNQNNYNYSNVRNKIPSNQGDSNQFVYNMIYTTHSIRTDEITKRLNELKKPNQTDSPHDNKPYSKKQVSHHKVNNKKKISCCFFSK